MPISTVSTLPTPPSRANPADFATKADAFLGALPTFGSQLNTTIGQLNQAVQFAVATYGSGVTATTTTTATTASSGSVVFVIAAGKSFVAGQQVCIWSEYDSAGMVGTVTAYTGTNLTVSLSGVAGHPGGMTRSNWSIFLIPVTFDLQDAPVGVEVFFPPSLQSVLARTATESRDGFIEIATIAEVLAGTDSARAVTPEGLASIVPVLPDIPPVLTLPFDSMRALPGAVRFTRASSGRRLNAAAIITSEAENVPRFDFNGDGTPRGLLIERTSSNKLTYSDMLDVTHRLEITSVTGVFLVDELVQFTGGGSGYVSHYAPSTTAYLGIRDAVGTLSGTASTTSGSGTVSASYTVSTRANINVTPNALNGMDKLVETAVSGNHAWISGSVAIAAGGVVTYSFLAKKGGRDVVKALIASPGYANSVSCTFNLTTGTASTASQGSGGLASYSMRSVGNDIYLCSLSGIVDSTSTTILAQISLLNGGSVSYLGDTSCGVYIKQQQLEYGNGSTSYIETLHSITPVRSMDIASVDLSEIDFNTAEGTLYCEFSVFAVASTQRLVGLDDDSNANVISLFVSSLNKVTLAVNSNSTAVVYSEAATVALHTPCKAAISFKDNEYRLSVNGGTPVSDTSGTLPLSLGVLRLGHSFGALQPLNGHLLHVSYFPRALTIEQLQAITS